MCRHFISLRQPNNSPLYPPHFPSPRKVQKKLNGSIFRPTTKLLSPDFASAHILMCVQPRLVQSHRTVDFSLRRCRSVAMCRHRVVPQSGGECFIQCGFLKYLSSGKVLARACVYVCVGAMWAAPGYIKFRQRECWHC